MTAEEFVRVFKGFIDINGTGLPTDKQWGSLIGKLYSTCSKDEKTPESPEIPEEAWLGGEPFSVSEDLSEIGTYISQGLNRVEKVHRSNARDKVKLEGNALRFQTPISTQIGYQDLSAIPPLHYVIGGLEYRSKILNIEVCSFELTSEDCTSIDEALNISENAVKNEINGIFDELEYRLSSIRVDTVQDGGHSFYILEVSPRTPTKDSSSFYITVEEDEDGPISISVQKEIDPSLNEYAQVDPSEDMIFHVINTYSTAINKLLFWLGTEIDLTYPLLGKTEITQMLLGYTTSEEFQKDIDEFQDYLIEEV